MTTASPSAPRTTARWHRLTPEGAVAAQEALGADIQMVLDVCTELPAGRERADRGGRAHAGLGRAGPPGACPGRPAAVRDRAGRRGARPAGRVRRAAGRDRLRRLRHRRSFRRGDSRPRCWRPWLLSTANLPADSPRYLMGVGDPASVVQAIGLGVDMFDCVLPTRLGRHGSALTSAGRLHVKAGPLCQGRFAARPGLCVPRLPAAYAGPTCGTSTTWANRAPAASSASTTSPG